MDNADQAELEKFDAIAENWWDLEGEFKPLHQINPLRLEFICAHAGDLSGNKILDVGCGGGILAESMAKLGAEVTGIDLATGALNIAREHCNKNSLSIDYQRISVEELAAQTPEHFDIVTCMEMLEHVPDPTSIVRACSEVLKPDGLIFLSTLNRNPKSFVLAILAAEYALNMVPRGTHDYGKFIKPSELSRALRQENCITTDICGIRYQPLKGNFELDKKDIDVNFLMCAKKND